MSTQAIVDALFASARATEPQVYAMDVLRVYPLVTDGMNAAMLTSCASDTEHDARRSHAVSAAAFYGISLFMFGGMRPGANVCAVDGVCAVMDAVERGLGIFCAAQGHDFDALIWEANRRRTEDKS